MFFGFQKRTAGVGQDLKAGGGVGIGKGSRTEATRVGGIGEASSDGQGRRSRRDPEGVERVGDFIIHL